MLPPTHSNNVLFAANGQDYHAGNIHSFQSPASHGGLCIAWHRRAWVSEQIDPDHNLPPHSKRDDLQDTFLDAVEVERPAVAFKKKLWNSV